MFSLLGLWRFSTSPARSNLIPDQGDQTRSTSMDLRSLKGKRILLTQADQFMGPALARVFAELGAEVIADTRSPVPAEAPEAMVQSAGEIDVLVANLAIAAPSTPALSVDDAEWRDVFAHLVDPLPRLVRAAVPTMRARGGGKILVMGSTSALRGMKRASTYSAARGAQISYVQAVGVELAPMNIQVNAIAQTSSTIPPISPRRSRPTRPFRTG
jgi:2-keto-3-deoxy-L-fuconate dehydrogenase